MAALIEHKFFLSEIVGRRVYLKNQRIGRLDDLVIVETEKFPEVSHFVVTRSFGYPALLVPWDRVTLISNTEIVVDLAAIDDHEQVPSAGAILLKDHILDKKILDLMAKRGETLEGVLRYGDAEMGAYLTNQILLGDGEFDVDAVIGWSREERRFTTKDEKSELARYLGYAKH